MTSLCLALTRTRHCVGIIDVDGKAHGALLGAVSKYFRPEVDLGLDVVRLYAVAATSTRWPTADLRRALSPASVDFFDLRQGSDWLLADTFLSDAYDRPGERRAKPRIIMPLSALDRLGEILSRRKETNGVFVTGVGAWRSFFGSDLCMQLTKRWIGLDDPTFRLEPLSTFANFATTGRVDRAWLEWMLFDRAQGVPAAPEQEVILSINLAEGLPIGQERVAAYRETLKRLLRDGHGAV